LVGALLATVSRLQVLRQRDRRGALEELPPGGLIVVANHTSYADGLLLALAGRRLGRSLRLLGTSGIVEAPGLRILTRRLGFVPVRRGTDRAADALEPAAEAIRAGEAVALYPEGRTTRDPDHWPERGKTGAVRLALMTDAPIIPIASVGAHEVAGRRKLFRSLVVNLFRRPKVLMTVGEPIDVRARLGLAPGQEATPEQVRAATDEVMAMLVSMLEELRGEPAPTRD
jgi:1-acyl-sn-glycerol-3-phosphate acyltransferase